MDVKVNPSPSPPSRPYCTTKRTSAPSSAGSSSIPVCSNRRASWSFCSPHRTTSCTWGWSGQRASTPGRGSSSWWDHHQSAHTRGKPWKHIRLESHTWSRAAGQFARQVLKLLSNVAELKFRSFWRCVLNIESFRTQRAERTNKVTSSSFR